MSAGGNLMALAQCRHPWTALEAGEEPWRAALAVADAWMARAVDQGAGLIVFPENFSAPWSLSDKAFAATGQPLEGRGARFVNGMRALARARGLWAVFTTNELDGAGRLFNTAVIVDDGGAIGGTYRKMHLFDACEQPESARYAAGSQSFAPIESPFGKLGLGICYDLRFPDLAQTQARAGCDLLIYPASWFDGPGKVDQWNALLSERARQTGATVVGVSRPDHPWYAGSSRIVAPDGTVVAQAGREEELVIAPIPGVRLQGGCAPKVPEA